MLRLQIIHDYHDMALAEDPGGATIFDFIHQEIF